MRKDDNISINNKECPLVEYPFSDDGLGILGIMGHDGLELKYTLRVYEHERYEKIMKHLYNLTRHER